MKHSFASTLTVAALLLAAAASARPTTTHAPGRLEDTADYWALAKHTVPSAVTGTMDLVERNLTSQSAPSMVKPMRIALLRARATLDIFAMAYPATSTPAEEQEEQQEEEQQEEEGADNRLQHGKDVWGLLRRDLDVGYEVVGAYQDLDHSQVDYCDADAKEKLKACLDWLEKLKANRKRYDYDAFVCKPANGTLHVHQHMSKFWWGYGGVIPLPHVSGMENMVRLLRDAQAVHALDLHTDVQRAQHVYMEPDHTLFHTYRKLIRSMLVLLDLFPSMLPPAPPTTTVSASGAAGQDAAAFKAAQQQAPVADRMPAAGAGGQPQAAGSSHSASVLAIASGTTPATHPAASSTSRCLLTRRALPKHLPGSSGTAAGAGGSSGGGGGGNGAAPCHQQEEEERADQLCDPHGAVANLRHLFKELGQVNNKVVAFEFYTGKGRRHKADKARRECDAAWRDLKAWMAEVNVPHMIRCLAASLVAR